MLKSIKILLVTTLFILVLTSTTSGFVSANEDEPLPLSDEIANDSYIVDTPQQDIIDSDELIGQDRIAPIIPYLASAVISLVIKQGGKHVVKNISKHALIRAGQRGITKHQFAHTMRYGIKYTDKKTGAKIRYDKSSKTTLVIKGNTVVTVYKQSYPKKVWRKGH